MLELLEDEAGDQTDRGQEEGADGIPLAAGVVEGSLQQELACGNDLALGSGIDCLFLVAEDGDAYRSERSSDSRI